MMKDLFKRFRKESANKQPPGRAADQPSLISRSQPALKRYQKPPPKPEVVEEEGKDFTVELRETIGLKGTP